MNKVQFPKGLQEIRDLLPKILQILQEGEDWYAFVTLDDMEQKAVSASVTDSIVIQKDRGLVMRILSDGQNNEYATNNLDLDYLEEKAKQFKATVIGRRSTATRCKFANYTPLTWQQEDLNSIDILMQKQLPETLTADTQIHFGTFFEMNPDETNLTWMSKQAQNFKSYLKDKAGDNANIVGVLFRQKIKTKIFVDREKNMSQSLLTSLGYAYTVSPQGLSSREIKGGMAGFEAAQITKEDLDELATMPRKMDSAKKLKPGRYPIITGPDVTGVIAHEAFGHTQEGDTCRYGRSCAPGLRKENNKMGNDLASIVNHAGVFSMGQLNYGQNGSHFFDDEGQLAREHVILDQGYLQSPMNDLMSSIVGDVNGISPRQSNGKRESWRNPIMARQTNTYFTGGDKTLDEMLAQMGDGYIAEYAYGGMEDPKGMGLTAGTEYLEEVKDGKRTGRLFLGPKGGHIELSDPVPLLLKTILAKSKIDEGSDAQSTIPYNKWGGCGKYHKESVEAGSGGPWIYWEGINCG
jgi:TldD protein